MRIGRNGMTMAAGCLLLLAGCGTAADEAGGNQMAVATPTAPVATAPITSASAAEGWIGRWTGVEGLSLNVAATEQPGTYKLHITSMDGSGDYIGKAEGDLIRFTRDGKAEVLRETTGAETGLKWLAGKLHCLTIRQGEGFCRD